MPTISGSAPASPLPATHRSAERVEIYGHEGDGADEGSLQPVARDHFGSDPVGRPTLSGPRVAIEMPDVVAVRVHEVRLNEVLESVPSPFGATPEADADDRFHAAPGTARAGALSAFYVTTQMIDAADRWAGHRVAWGDDGRLTVAPYELVTSFFNAYYDMERRTLALGALGVVEAGSDRVAPYVGEMPGASRPSPGLVVDGVKSRDIVSHEAAHAVLHALKPGLTYGVGLAFQEGFADAMAALTALTDDDVVRRVLDETGGDLTQENEVTRLAEEVGVLNAYSNGHGDDTSAMRSLLEDHTLSSLRVRGRDTDVRGMMFLPQRSPHVIGHVFSRAVWHIVTRVFEANRAAGVADEDALAVARDVAGTLLVRASRYLPEHDLSFDAVAHAMVRVEAETFGGAHRETLVAALQARELLPPDFDADAFLQERASALPDFTLAPALTDAADVIAALAAYEEEQVAAVTGTRGRHTHLLWHDARRPQLARTTADEVTLYSDVTDEDGYRVVRLRYEAGDDPDAMTTHWVSATFAPDGKLTGVQSDAPNPPTFGGSPF